MSELIQGLAAELALDPAFTAAFGEAVAANALTPDYGALAIEIHADNVKAGWWSDLKTGESTLHTRNRPEMLMLAVSELAEAAEGAHGLMDDKLPHLPMYDVELADFVIRQLDQIGAEVSCGHPMPDWTGDKEHCRKVMRPLSRNERLVQLVMMISTAMEHYRKRRVESYVSTMAGGVWVAFVIAEIEGIDLLGIIQQKRGFNATRADHQIANRVKDGGKAF